MPSISPATLAVLAGGLGSRMGGRKDRLTVGGKPILEHLLDRLAFDGPTVLVASPAHPEPIGYRRFDRVVHDREPDGGPMVGLISALSATDTRLLCVLSVDMPHVGPEQLGWLLDSIDRSPARMAVLCGRADEGGPIGIEPFPCVVRTSVLPTLEIHFAAGGRSMKSLLDVAGLEMRQVPQSWSSSVWLNLNRPHDLQKLAENDRDFPRPEAM